MKVNRRYATLVAALAGVGFGTVVAAQGTSSSSSSTAPMGRHWHHHARGSMLVGTLLRAAHQLNLTADQKQTIKSLLVQARSENRSSASARPDITVLGNPGDANYATVVQGLQSQVSTRLQRESALANSIYSVLTPEQKQQLPTVLASMKAKAQARRAAWQAQHAASGTGTSN